MSELDPDFVISSARPVADSRPSSSPAEETLIRIWSEVLGNDRIGPRDDFFAMGGNPEFANRAAEMIRAEFGVDVSGAVVVGSPTVAALAERLAELVLADAMANFAAPDDAGGAPTADRIPQTLSRTEPKGARTVPAIARTASSGRAPLSFAQQGLWFLDQLTPGSTEYSVPFGFRVGGRLDVEALGTAFSGLVRRHEVLRTRFDVDAGEEPLQIVQEETPVIPRVVDLSTAGSTEAAEAAARELLADEASRPFDLTNGRLLRVLVVRLADDDHVVAICLHHIVAD
ncbi:condensation domain-containing protein, partial [Streptomyces sp. NPDC006544]|uniref:condensation domain-containing protein n=1 Tax=Streptomyces sp. NPDC006544 TaxID=3154583 RepID=UPI0033A434CF